MNLWPRRLGGIPWLRLWRMVLKTGEVDAEDGSYGLVESVVIIKASSM